MKQFANSMGELCPILNTIKTILPQIDQATTRQTEYVTYRIRKIDGVITPETIQNLQGLIMSGRDYIVTVCGCETELLELHHSGRLIGQIIAGRLKRGYKILFSRAGTIFPVTWNNYKQVWDELTYTPPKREPNDRIRRPKRSSAERMFEDAQRDDVTRKKATGGKRLPRPHEIQPALTEKTVTRYIFEL